MRILQATQSPPDYIPPPTLAPDQVICGPQYPDRRDSDSVRSIATQKGAYDIAEVVARLPSGQRPELFVCRADSSGANMPRNVASLGCRTALIIGDTHHLRNPITSLLAYALAEPYDVVILDYTRQHAHFFLEAGLKRVYWLPGFNVDRVVLPPVPRPDIPMSFVGQTGEFHRRRHAVIEALTRAGLPLKVGEADRANARLIHARTQINLNCSLNGDLNLRVFEVVASGGFLLTDRLGPESGLDLLLKEGRHYVAYDGIEDCIEKSRRYLRDRVEAAAIARAGKARYERVLAPERIRADFLALLERGIARPEFDLKRDRRIGWPKVSDRAALMARIAVYEVLQALQLSRERSAVLASASVDPAFLIDAGDLVRVGIAVDASSGETEVKFLADFLSRVGMERAVRLLRRSEEIAPGPWDALVTTRAEWRRHEHVFARNPQAVLILADLGDIVPADIEAAGFQRLSTRGPVFTRA